MKYIPLTTRLTALLFPLAVLLCHCERDFFPHGYQNIYGDWTIRSISGGFSGGSINPSFDILRIDRKMRFFLFRNDTLVSNGTIQIKDEINDQLMIKFVSNDNILNSFDQGKIVNLSQDTLILSDNCADCYSYYFVRSEIYNNENYIQPVKRLDYLEVNSYQIGFNKYYTSVYFKNENFGFIACYDGSILKTIDGGKNWKLTVTNNTLPLYGISFINENIGYAAGGESSCGGTGCIVPGYILLKTSDSGETWEKVNLPYKPAEFETIRFFDTNFGIAFGKGVKLKTTDGGQSWEDITSNNLSKITSLYFLSDKIVYVAGLKNQLFKSTDSGETWNNIGSNINDYIRALMFINEQVGYISFWYNLLKTTNGGQTWNIVDYAPEGIALMHFNSETSAVAFGTRTYASSKWDVWDSHFNILADGKWYGDERVSYHAPPFMLDNKHFFTITWDNKITVIKITN
jgi:photosystem II stability/assembly factor-like uncharacterized protein